MTAPESDRGGSERGGSERGGSERGGLRERKKQATREALSVAALRLAVERGLDNVRVDDIAAAAGVSPRTYNNYFSSREQAICALAVERAVRVGEALRARPADEPLGEAVVEAMVEEYVGHAEPDKAMIRFITGSPALRGEFLKSTTSLERPLAEAIAARTGADPDQDLQPRVLAAALSGATRAATEWWLRPESSVPFASVLREAVAAVLPATVDTDTPIGLAEIVLDESSPVRRERAC